jgi:putative transposase
MPQVARIDVENNWYHIVSRGQRREPLFVDGYDRRIYLNLLSSIFGTNRALLGAYCLMTNHIHLLVYRSREKFRDMTF